MKFKMKENYSFTRRGCLFCSSYERLDCCMVEVYEDAGGGPIGIVCHWCLEVGANRIKVLAIEQAKKDIEATKKQLEGAKGWLEFLPSQDFSGFPAYEEFNRLNKKYAKDLDVEIYGDGYSEPKKTDRLDTDIPF